MPFLAREDQVGKDSYWKKSRSTMGEKDRFWGRPMLGLEKRKRIGV